MLFPTSSVVRQSGANIWIACLSNKWFMKEIFSEKVGLLVGVDLVGLLSQYLHTKGIELKTILIQTNP